MSAASFSPGITDVVARFDSMLGDDADLEVGSLDNGALHLVYRTAGDVACEACVLAPDDLEILVLEALQVRSDAVTSVIVDVTSDASAIGPEEDK